MAVSNYQDIINQIEVALSQIEGVGNVHPYFRIVKDDPDIREVYIDANNKVNAWFISRTAIRDEQLTSYGNEIVWDILIEGWLSVEDVLRSEITFQETIDRIKDGFQPQTDLDDTLTKIELTRPIQATEIGAGMLGEVYCHHCILTFELQILESSV